MINTIEGTIIHKLLYSYKITIFLIGTCNECEIISLKSRSKFVYNLPEKDLLHESNLIYYFIPLQTITDTCCAVSVAGVVLVAPSKDSGSFGNVRIIFATVNYAIN